MRTTFAFLFALTILVPASLAATDGAAFVVPAGSTLVAPVLVTTGDLIVDGELVAPEGADLVLRVGGDLIVNGLVRAGHASVGARGGDLDIEADHVFVSEGALLAAGAGGHGALTVALGDVARGGAGGRGGSVRITAESVELVGDVVPGSGGRGGDAFGLHSFGGDAGAMGTLLVDDEPQAPSAFASNPQAPVTLATEPRAASACGILTPTGVPAAPLSGANGGNACAEGSQGAQGATGEAGDDDNGPWAVWNYPACDSFVTGTPEKSNGEKGGPGGMGQPGTPAVAIGGKGSDVTSGTGGNGGNAIATGGKGGTGGTGGQGGDAKNLGHGCEGGPGGTGGIGGAAQATGGLQGLNLADCTKNGGSGVPTAYGGAAGSPGAGGPGGYNTLTGNQGSSGPGGSWGSAGPATATTPPTVPCIAPAMPGLTATANPIFCDRAVLHIVAPSTVGSNPIGTYKIYRNNVYLSSVAYTLPLQHVTVTGLAASTMYVFEVSAVSIAGESPRSNAAFVTTTCTPLTSGGALDGPLGPAISTIDPPTIVASPGLVPGTIDLLVTPSVLHLTDTSAYEVYRSTTSGGPYGFVTNVTFTSVLGDAYLDVGLLPSTTYYYVARGVTASGTSGDSLETSASTPSFMMVFGGGSQSGETSGAGGRVTSSVSCTGPLVLTFALAPRHYAVTTKFAPGTNQANPDPSGQSGGCETLNPAHSRAFTSDKEMSPGIPRANECADEQQPDSLERSAKDERVYTITSSCKGPTSSTVETTTIRISEDGTASFSQTFATYGSSGSFTIWSAAGKLPRRSA